MEKMIWIKIFLLASIYYFVIFTMLGMGAIPPENLRFLMDRSINRGDCISSWSRRHQWWWQIAGAGEFPKESSMNQPESLWKRIIVPSSIWDRPCCGNVYYNSSHTWWVRCSFWRCRNSVWDYQIHCVATPWSEDSAYLYYYYHCYQMWKRNELHI